ncbi:unnamed protein product [Closterium sp. NIES-53]
MTSLRVLAFDHEGRPVQFDTWLDDLQLHLMSDSKDSVSLFDLASGAATAPPATADIKDLVSHLHPSDARYRAAVPAKFLDRNPPPMYITLYFIVTRLPDSLCSVRDHFLSLDPTSLTADLLEQHLLAAETSAVAVSAARGTPCPPFFEGCSPSPLAPSYASAAAADASVSEDVGIASASAKRRTSKGKGGRGGGGGSGGGGGGSRRGGGGSSGGGGGGGRGGGSGGGSRGGSGGSSGGGGGSGGSGSSGCGGRGGGGTGAQRTGSLREWFLRGSSGGSCPYVIRTGDRASQTCGRLHTQHRYFSRLNVAWRAEFGDDVELPRWADLLKSRIAIFDLDFDAILSAMYALSVSAEGDYYLCVLPDPNIAAAALGASESGTLPGTAPAEALHAFTLDSGAFRWTGRGPFLHYPPMSGGSVRLIVRSSPPLVLYELGSSLYTLATKPPHVVASAQVSASGQVAASCSCRLMSHQTLLWHHRLVHPSLPCLRGMHSCLLVSGLPRSLPPLPPSPTLPCLPCVEGWQRAAPHSSSFPPTSAPLQTLHMDVWGPARVSGQSRERYFLLVLDNYMRYTTVIPLRSKGQVVDVFIPWIRIVRLQLRERFGQDLPVLRLHSNRGGEFSSKLLREFCRGEGILPSFTLLDSPQQNGIAERHIGLVIEVARTSMIHAVAPHFLWSFAVQYATHQLNLWPRVSLPETSATLRWTGEVGDASVFRVWGSRAFVLDTSADKLSPRAIPYVFLGFDVTFDESVPFYRIFPYRSTPPPPPPLFLAPGPPPVDPLLPQGRAPSGVSQVDPLPGPAICQVAVGSSAAQGATSRGAASGGAEPGGARSEGAETGGAGSEGAETVGAEPGGVGTGGAEPEGVEPGGVALEGAESGGAEPQGAASSGGSTGASPRLSPQQLREWFARRARLWSVATGAGAAGAGGVGVAAGASGAGGAVTTGPGGARTWGTGAAGSGAVEGAGAVGPDVGGGGAAGEGARDTGAVDPYAGGAGGTLRLQPYIVPLLQQDLGTPSSTGLTPPLLCPPPDHSQPPLQTASPLPAPSPYTEQSGGLTERREPASHPVSPVRTARRAPRSRRPPVPGTHAMVLRPSSIPLRVPLPAPLDSSLPEVPNPESDRARAVSLTVSRLLATAVTDSSFDSAAACALVAELLDFAAACRLDYATALVVESVSASPPSVGGECALGTDVLEDRQEDFQCLSVAVPCFASMLLAPEGDPDAQDIPTPRSYAEAIMGPYSSQWQAAMDAEMASWKSTGTYVDEVPPPGANIVDGMWIFRVKRPPGSPPAFKARYVAQGFSQRQGVDYFHTFSPTPKMTTLRVLLHVATQRDYELHSLDFSTAFMQGSVHEEIWLRRPPGFTSTFPVGTQWSLRRPVYGLRQAPCKWHDTLRTTLAALGFAPSTADPSLFLHTDTSLPPFYVLVSFSALASISPRHSPLLCLPATHSQLHLRTSPTSGLGLVLGGRGPVVLTGHGDASWVDDSPTQRSSQGYTFSLGSGYVSWRSTHSSSVLSSSCEAEIYAGAMAAQELLWLTYLLTDLGEQPRSPLVLYVDNKAMIALCQEHRLEHRTKHIALRYFLARELQQRGELHLAYVATRASTADVFTKALLPGDHQRFATLLGFVPTLPHLLTN